MLSIKFDSEIREHAWTSDCERQMEWVYAHSDPSKAIASTDISRIFCKQARYGGFCSNRQWIRKGHAANSPLKTMQTAHLETVDSRIRAGESSKAQ